MYGGSNDPDRHHPFYEDYINSGQASRVSFPIWLQNTSNQVQQGAEAPQGAGSHLQSLYNAGQASNPSMNNDRARAARNDDMRAGQMRWMEATRDPRYQEVMRRYQDMSQGLNAQEMQAAREQMQMGQQSQRQQALRSLYSQQAKSGVRGGMAGAQNVRLQQKLGQDRNAAEQALLLQNYNLRRQGLQDYGTQVNRDIFGRLGTGLSEAQLGVADRTGAQQMAMANQQYQNSQPQGLFARLARIVGL